MIYLNNNPYGARSINIFGGGELFNQLKPMLDRAGIQLLKVFDDTRADEEYCIEKYIRQDNVLGDLLYCVGYKDMQARFERFKQLKEMGFQMVSFIADHVIRSDSHIGNGTIIKPGAIIDDFASIGECSFVNIGAMISHNAVIADNVYISPGVNICGYSTINEGVFIGANATIIDHIVVGEYAAIGAGAVVLRNVPPHARVVGNPGVII